MTLLAIPTVIGNAISALSAHHGHKKGVEGDGADTAVGKSTSDTSSSGQPSGSAQSLFGALLDSVEQVVGIRAPAVSSTTAKPQVNSSPIAQQNAVGGAPTAISLRKA